jgi:hypothetical protein
VIERQRGQDSKLPGCRLLVYFTTLFCSQISINAVINLLAQVNEGFSADPDYFWHILYFTS